MKKMILLSLLTVSMFVNARPNQASTPKVIYGEDNRVDVFATPNEMYRELSRSTAAMIDRSSLIARAGSINVRAGSLESNGMCASERFSQQLTAANCSGFLVAPNKLVTAGHCVQRAGSCANYQWVFDYKVEADDQKEVVVSPSNVYSCKRVIKYVLDGSTEDDWALIELDREVADRRVLETRKSGQIEVGAPIVVIGHPSGLPTKIADGANVRSLNDKFFVANLDTYGGNSGSAVFNAETGIVEGILVRGETDYVYDYRNGCRASNIVGDNAGRGEDVTFITNVEGI